jgi:uncharacterized protein (TIGR02757 family)
MQHGREKKNLPHTRDASRIKGRLATPAAALGPFLDELVRRYHSQHWLDSDPIQFPRRFSRADDREVVAFIAACFAYGSVTLIHRAVNAVLAPMGENPADFIRGFDGKSHWPGFYHRFHHEEHVTILMLLLKKALAEYGSLGRLFQARAEDGEGVLAERVLNGAARWLQDAAREEVDRARRPDLLRGMLFFFNAPADGSACKRMTMFLRWMVRRDEIDLGLWDWLSPRDLVIPADTHVGRIAYYLRLRSGTEKRAPDWRMACEITASLREIKPEDPTLYDFALARLGILSICRKHYARSVCERCPVEPGCRYSNLRRRACKWQSTREVLSQSCRAWAGTCSIS